MNKIYILFLFVMFFSCSQKQTDTFLKVEFLEKVTFSLDSVTPNYFIAMEALKHGDKQYLTFLNSLTNTIYYYDLIDSKLERELRFNVGETGISRGVMNYNHLSADSIFVFGAGLYSYITDYSGEIIDTFQLIDFEFRQSPYSSSVSPVIFDGKALYFNSMVWGQYSSDYMPFMRYKLDTKKINLYGRLPEVYHNNGDWGAFSFDYAYQIPDLKNHRIIYSFPASNTLFYYNVSDLEFGEIANSETFTKISPPFSSSNYTDDIPEWHLAMNSKDMYGSLLFDNVTNRVFRWFKYGVKSNQKDPNRPLMLIEFSYPDLIPINYFKLPEDEYVSENSFVIENKLFLRLKGTLEDEITFHKFDLF